MRPINILIERNSLGRVVFEAQVSKGDFKSFGSVWFKLDSGSDFTTLHVKDLYDLGFTHEQLKNCPVHSNLASTASEDGNLTLQYLSNISVKFGDRELQGCRVFFALDTNLRSLFGSDLLKYFNYSVSYDDGILRLTETKEKPILSKGEVPIQIYSLD
jgi:hypothetical protein